jgi:hypothetical protein
MGGIEKQALGGVADGELLLATLSGPTRLPTWASWFVELGATHARHAVRPNERRWTVVTVPDRRFAATLVAHGAVRAKARAVGQPSVTDRFANTFPGSRLTWIDSNGKSRFGRYDGIDDQRIHYHPRDHGGWGVRTSRLLEMATTFWPACEDDEFVGARPLANDSSFAVAAIGLPAEHFLATSRIDAIVVGTRTELEKDLNDRCFSSRGHAGALIDTVRPKDLVGLGQHHRSMFVPSVMDPDNLVRTACEGPSIFDGPAAYLRLRDELRSASNIIILDRWNPRAEDAAAAAVIERNETFIETADYPLQSPPPAIEVFGWTEEQ